MCLAGHPALLHFFTSIIIPEDPRADSGTVILVLERGGSDVTCTTWKAEVDTGLGVMTRRQPESRAHVQWL